MKFAIKPILHYTYLSSGRLIHYLGKLKSIFVDIQQIQKKNAV